MNLPIKGNHAWVNTQQINDFCFTNSGNADFGDASLEGPFELLLSKHHVGILLPGKHYPTLPILTQYFNKHVEWKSTG